MARTAVLGLPRVGPNRELKTALEARWSGRATDEELLAVAREQRAALWRRAADAGIDVICVGDASLYDHVLDTAVAVGAVEPGLDAYFEAARGARPLEMTKWFDTNYHYLVPRLTGELAARPDHWLEQLAEARALGIEGRPVILGPWSFVQLAKAPLSCLDALLPVYAELVDALDAREFQIDEPCLVTGRYEGFERAWRALEDAAGERELCLTTYFGRVPGEVFALGAAEIHLDLVRAPEQLEPALAAVAGGSTRLSLGVIDGRNVWAADLERARALIDRAITALGEDRVTIAPSCSLLHVPYDASRERALPGRLAFAYEKLEELALLKAGEWPQRAVAPVPRDESVRARVAALRPADYARSAPYAQRAAAQRERVALPPLPTTTIGSFPQTAEIRRARRELRSGALGAGEYERFMRERIAEAIELQEELGLDMLVHGEAERADMVEYFGEQLEGFAFTEHGWVQSYGSRCVKPPILHGDVSRPEPMTLAWWRHAQSLTSRPVKGMLTGPVTILQWSFVRDDQPRRETCTQIALAIQDEVRDLEAAGCFAIQIDEAALREGLPLHPSEQDEYVRWAVDCFRLTAAPARPETQIHTHMCYSEFGEMIEHIARLDADVLSIEASRSDMELLDVFDRFEYPNEIGPGVYDIHSPRVPEVEEIERLLALAEARLGRERLWVNPDCGLKTRGWEETLPALENLVAAARRRRMAA
ncbi:5-methyltetrahydropteroyltriglutamate--homocysteine S-methyltransferase [Candidatus Solirubrobacter pratensis]|uniref:5-methyltetrahydropteroyltriglutamate-- homocysteine S-methyltransferase n=1 Tax=Candidatus Solirubrobacter pratensis TaxID=1298857 RepID=UPI00041E9B60|nr:5-methyltetrahydropteroyltriglutamate--homocysteine S-methyltransferase [Candidatus Solirubrobacter pratensis]